jgi:hypothetical protein
VTEYKWTHFCLPADEASLSAETVTLSHYKPSRCRTTNRHAVALQTVTLSHYNMISSNCKSLKSYTRFIILGKNIFQWKYFCCFQKSKGKAVSTVTGLEWPRGFQEVKVPRFHDDTGWW